MLKMKYSNEEWCKGQGSPLPNVCFMLPLRVRKIDIL